MEPKAPHANCSACPLQKAKFVPSNIPEGAKVALVSRAPGSNDTDAPFTGPSREVVDYLLKKYKHSRENTILTNVVLCQTDSPPKEAIAACKPRLEHELNGIQSIIAAGTEAVSEFTQFRSVSKARGFVHTDEKGRRVIAANNPALVLRESDSFPTLVTDFKLALDPLPDPIFPEVEVINDASVGRDRLQEWYDNTSGTYATDLEWSGLDIYCAGFSTSSDRATVFGRRVITDPECFRLIKYIYESDKIHSCWHTGKSDTTVLWRNGIRARVDNDTFLLSYALDEEPGRHSLDYLLQTVFGWPYYTPKSVEYFKKSGKLDFYGTEPQQIARAEYELYEYNGWDTAGTLLLFNELKDKALKDNVYHRPYLETLLPAADAFRSVELHGFRFDAEGSANIMEAEVLPKLDELKTKMQKTSGLTLLNPRSNAQLKVLYYNTWGLKHNLRDKAKQKLSASTGREVREEIEGGRFTCKPQYKDTLVEFADYHRAFAKVERQRSNYFQPLIERIDEFGYIHPWFNLGGTVTGRTSSTEPNFQNITREGVEGITSVRELFLPSEGNIIVAADYCVAPETRVLKTDLTWSRADKLILGEKLIGFDRGVGQYHGNSTGLLEESEVLSTRIITRPCYKITTDRGTVTASAEHLFVGKDDYNRPRKWIRTDELKVGNWLSFYVEPWEVDESREGGYIAGFLDGEGWISNTTLSFAQNSGEVLNRVLGSLKEKGFNPTWQNATGTSCEVYFFKGFAEAVKAVGTFRPTRFMAHSRGLWYRRRTWGSNSKVATILNIEFLGDREVIALKTSTQTFIAEGFLSHNSQAELRTMAKLSGEPNLLEIYMDTSRSLHRERAAAFYGENYTKEEYVKSKNINFGVSYGQSAAAFAQMYHMPREEAQAYIDSWWRTFPKLQSWTKDIGQEAHSGEVISPLGYKRRFHLITRDNINDIEREAVNFVPQNTAGGFTIHAVTELTKHHGFLWHLDTRVGKIEVEGMPIVNSVHDSIVADVPKDQATETAKVMKQVMESIPKKLLGWELPFTVDVSIGETWASVREIQV